MKLTREATDLGDLIRDTVAGFNAQALEKGVRFGLSLTGVGEVNVDPLRLREVLSNLIGNALRYTQGQGVVKVNLTGSGSGTVRSVLISVEDSGVGIPSADLPHVFERFYKSSDSGGMGLGLSIARGYRSQAHFQAYGFRRPHAKFSRPEFKIVGRRRPNSDLLFPT